MCQTCLPCWLRLNKPHILFVDWIQDSILERNRRIRNARTVYASRRGPNGEVTIPWLWTQFRKAVDTGQSWIVVSIVGTPTVPPSGASEPKPHQSTPPRRLYRAQRSHYFHHHRMAVRYQDGVLFGWLVVEPTVLLLGDRWGGDGRLRLVASLEHCDVGAMADLCDVCGTSHLNYGARSVSSDGG